MKTALLLTPISFFGLCGGGSQPAMGPEPLEYEDCIEERELGSFTSGEIEDIEVETRSSDDDSDNSSNDDDDSSPQDGSDDDTVPCTSDDDDSQGDSDDNDSDNSSDDSDSNGDSNDDDSGSSSDDDDSSGNSDDDDSEEGCEPLPIELLYFNGTWDDDRSIVVRWATASEINVSHYEVHMIEPCTELAFDASTIVTEVQSESPAGGERYTTEIGISRGGLYYLKLVEVTLDGVKIDHNVIAVRAGN